jgi:hypothetical protein
MVLTPDLAVIAARFCAKCAIAVCGGCAGISLSDRGVASRRSCPRCDGETRFADASDLQSTQTRLS